MRLYHFRILFILFVLFGGSCTPKTAEQRNQALAEEVADLNNKNRELITGLTKDIQVLRERRNSIMVQGRALHDGELAFIDDVNDLIAEQGQLNRYLDDINRSENAYEPNQEELLYLNQQAHEIVRNLQKKIKKIQKSDYE